MGVDFKVAASFLKALTWEKLAQIAVLLFMLFVFYIGYQFRESAYASIKMGALTETDYVIVIELTSETKIKITETVSKFPTMIAGIQVVNINFKKNTRTASYSFISEPLLKQAIDDFQNSSIADTPIFNDNQTNNRRVVSLINGKFICTPYSDTVAVKTYAKASSVVTHICSVSIPPHYGKFSGYLNIYIKHKPDGIEIEMLRQLATELSNQIYINDILHEKSGNEKPVTRALRREDFR